MSGLSQTVTVNTAIDALSHAVEGMLSVRASAISDSMARQSIEMLAGCFGPMREGKLSVQNRADLLCASTLAGMVIANTGTTAVHAMGYSLTYYKNIDHGRANGLLLPEFLAFTAKQAAGRVQSILACMGLADVADFAALLGGLLGKRETLTPEELAHYAEKASKAGNIGNCLIRPEKDDLLAVLKAALG
jgi:alcohol dehydrogenase class IV